MTDPEDAEEVPERLTPERLTELREWWDYGCDTGADWVEDAGDLLDHIEAMEADEAAWQRNALDRGHELIQALNEAARLRASFAEVRERKDQRINELIQQLTSTRLRVGDANAEIDRLNVEIVRLTDVVIPHARTQGAADGFQQGWHAALTRVGEGGTLAVLRALVPHSR